MNICIATSSVSRIAGGIAGSTNRLVRQLAEDSLDTISVLSLRDLYSEVDASDLFPVVPELFSIAGPTSFGFSRGMLQRLIVLNPDIVHAHGLWMYPTVMVNRWAKCSGKPYVISPHGMLDSWAIDHSRWKKKIAGLIYQSKNLQLAACVHSLCQAETTAIRQYGMNNPICQIPNGIDLPNPAADYPQPQWLKFVPEGNKVLLYLGRIHPKKGLLNLLGAWAYVQRENTTFAGNWSLVIAGWDQGGHEAELMKFAKDSGISEAVVFVGPQFGEAKAACYHHADAFILPSFSEGLPMVVLEAWAYGLPLIMTPQCNIPEGFEKDAAVKIEPNISDISHGLMQLLQMGDTERMLMGKRGRSLVQERFAWEKIATQMKAVYQWVLGGGAPPDCVRLK